MPTLVATFASRADELEFRIRALATAYFLGEPCIDPVTGEEVSDPAYDDMVDELRTIRPDSDVLKDVQPTTSGTDPDAKIVKHSPPMTSIEKANGTEAEKAVILADWIADCLDELGCQKKTPNLFALDLEFDEPLKIFEQRLNHRGYEYLAEVLAEEFCLLYKRDGVACRLYYKKGRLVAAGLRPRNGVDGEDVTLNIPFVKGVPLDLGEDFTGAVQGELYCLRSVFERKNAEMLASGAIKVPYANERNYTTGSIRQFKDPTVTAEREINFIVHGAVAIETPVSFKTEYERARWFASKGFEVVRVSKFEFATLAKLEEMMSDLDYLVDGVVLKVSNLQHQEELGNHGGKDTGNPRGALAWKFRDEIAEVPVREIISQVGRTGGLTPVLEFGKTARLAGTNVDRATGHNITFLAINRIVPGVIVGVKKSGMIIPTVEYVLDGAGKPVYVRETDAAYKKKGARKLTTIDLTPYIYADKCPSCGHDTKIVEGAPGNFELVCPNDPLVCPAQRIRGLSHFLGIMGVKGIGESILGKLVAAGLKSPVDFYKYDVVDMETAGLSQRESLLAIAAIHGINNPSQYDDADLADRIGKAQSQKKKVAIWQLFASFGISGAGKTAGKAIQTKFLTLDAIRKAKPADFLTVDGIGAGTSHAIYEFFRDHSDLINGLLEYLEVEGPKTGKFTGLTFCLSGGFEPNKNHWKKEIEELGGVCKDGVGKTLHYLVEGDDAGSKVEKAKAINDDHKNKHKIEIIDLDRLKVMISS